METSLVLHRALTESSPVRDMRVSRRGILCATHRFISMDRGIHVHTAGRVYEGRYVHKRGTGFPLERVFRRTKHLRLYLRSIAIHVAPRVALSFRWLQQIGRSRYSGERLVERLVPSRLGVEHHKRIHQVFYSRESVVAPNRGSGRGVSHYKPTHQVFHSLERVFDQVLRPRLTPGRRESILKVVTLVNRLTEQYRRIEDVRSQERSHSIMDLKQAAQKLWPQVLEMVLRRDAAAVQAVRSNTVQETNPGKPRLSEENDKGLPQPSRSLSLAAFSPNELQRLTDQVVTRLDHRVIAMRERLGRR